MSFAVFNALDLLFGTNSEWFLHYQSISIVSSILRIFVKPRSPTIIYASSSFANLAPNWSDENSRMTSSHNLRLPSVFRWSSRRSGLLRQLASDSIASSWRTHYGRWLMVVFTQNGCDFHCWVCDGFQLMNYAFQISFAIVSSQIMHGYKYIRT